MNTVRPCYRLLAHLVLVISLLVVGQSVRAQSPNNGGASPPASNPGRRGVIPLTIKINARQLDPETELQNVDLTVSEDGDPQTILSIRGIGDRKSTRLN